MKKTITSLIITFFIINIFSQQIPLKKIDSMLVDIDKSTLTTNVLYDRVFPFARLSEFNDNINVANGKYFEQALSELYNASNNKKFVSLKQFRTQYTDKENYSTTNIGIINAKFNQLNYSESDTLHSAVRIVNNKFEKKATTSPIFNTQEVLIISPIKRYLTGNTITYHINTSFLIQENDKTITNIVANFDTPNDYTIYNNGNFTTQSIDINYTTTGEKTLTFVVTFSDDTSQTTQAIVHVKRLDPNHTPAQRWSSADAPNPNDFKFLGINGQLEYRIFYTDGNIGYNLADVQKPILIIDGFDPLDKRKIQDSDPHEGTDNDHDSIEDLMQFSDNQSVDQFIIPKLNLLGYDVIVINHPEYYVNGNYINGGADYIERNGFTHASFYQEINRNLALNGSNEKLVIMGPSMGGLISRIALAYMEKKEAETGMSSWNHNTRLWVSVDSPHLGANIPIGVQSLLNQLKEADNEDATDFVDKELASPAAKQLLIEQFNGWNNTQLHSNYLDARTISQGYSVDRGRPEFVTFYNNLFNNGLPNSKGYPQNLTKIALVNGSLANSVQYKEKDNNVLHSYPNDGQMTTNVRAFQNVKLIFSLFPEIIYYMRVHIGSAESYSMPAYGTSNKISRYKKAFNDKTKSITNINSRGSLDNSPGGFFPVYDEILEGVKGADPLAYPTGTFQNWENFGLTLLAWFSNDQGDGYMVARTNKHVSSFIPTPSALGMLNPDYQWNEDISRNLVCTDEIPFDSYYGEENNTNHVSFTENKFLWLKGWLEAGIDGPFPSSTVYLNAEDLIGDNVICNNQTKTYSFEECKTSGSITWEVSDNLEIISSSDNNITVRPIDNIVNGEGFIRFTTNVQTIQKNIWIGKPIIQIRKIDCDPIDCNVVIKDAENQGITSVQWQKVSGQGVLEQNQNIYSANIGGGAREWHFNGKVTAQNTCGDAVKYFTIHGGNNDGSPPCDPYYRMAKVANNQYKMVSVEDPCDPQAREVTRTINSAELYSAYGIKEENLVTSENKITLNNAQSGTIKIIKVIVDNKVVTKRVIVD